MPPTSFNLSAKQLERLEAMKAARGLLTRAQALRRCIEETPLEGDGERVLSELAD